MIKKTSGTLNGRTIEFNTRELSYEDIVTLSGLQGEPTVAYTKGIDGAVGTCVKGSDSLSVCEGIAITALDPDSFTNVQELPSDDAKAVVDATATQKAENGKAAADDKASAEKAAAAAKKADAEMAEAAKVEAARNDAAIADAAKGTTHHDSAKSGKHHR